MDMRMHDRLESRDAAVYRRGLAGHLTRTYDICGCGTVTSGSSELRRTSRSAVAQGPVSSCNRESLLYL